VINGTVESRKIKSHIQMPKFMLRQFENEKHELFYFDVDSGEIICGRAKSINVKEEYYSENVEGILSQAIERPFSQVIHYLEKIDFDARSFTVDPGIIETTKTFLNALLARNPNTFQKTQEVSVFLQFLDRQSQHDISVLTCINEASKLGFFDKMHLTFTVNKTMIPFVLPLCGFYWYNGGKNINLPISPKLAITLVDEEEMCKVILNNRIRMYLADKESDVRKLNYIAFQEQLRQGYGSIISPCMNALEDLIVGSAFED